MKNNIVDNCIENIHILNNTLAHVTGEIDISKYRKLCEPDELLDISKDIIVSINNIYHAITIDELFLLNCELLILELEGFQKLALCGALKTIKKFKPVIIFIKDNFDELEKTMGVHLSLDILLKKLAEAINYESYPSSREPCTRFEYCFPRCFAAQYPASFIQHFDRQRRRPPATLGHQSRIGHHLLDSRAY